MKVHILLTAVLAAFAAGAALAASEGGDTRSHVQRPQETALGQASTQEPTAPADPAYPHQTVAFEGADAWSRFLPWLQDPTTAARNAREQVKTQSTDISRTDSIGSGGGDVDYYQFVVRFGE